MAEYDPKPFTCECGLILGVIYREHNARTTQLRVLRNPLLSLTDIPATEAICKTYVMVKVNDASVLCERCGREVGWYAGQNAIEDMLARRNARRAEGAK